VVFIVEGLSRALAAVDQRSATARYVTADAVEHAHMHLYMRCALEVAETAGPAETAEHLVTMTRAIAEKPYKARTAAFAHVLKKKTRAAAFAAAPAGGAAAAPPDPEALFAGDGGDGSGGAGGTTALDTWLGALQMIPSLSEAKAVRVAAAYPTLRSLRRAFLAADPATAPRLLEVGGWRRGADHFTPGLVAAGPGQGPIGSYRTLRSVIHGQVPDGATQCCFYDLLRRLPDPAWLFPC
jgi:hypothetical protein